MTSKIYVHLDPGHGEDVAGKCSPDKRLREYKWARETMAICKCMLKDKGIAFADTTQGSSREPGLSVRANRANAIAKNFPQYKHVFVSIHCNAAGRGGWHNARGWSVWTTRGQNNSDKLAECMYNKAVKVFDGLQIRKDMSDGDHDWEANFTVIKKANMPAVLVENFFQDNEDDCKFLMSAEGKQKCARVIVDGICDYFGIK